VDADCWLAAENLMLAACALGLGTCCIGSAVTVLNRPDVKSELLILHETKVVVPIVIRIPAGPTPDVPRKAPEILSWKK
jgi:nitroreductase